MDKYTQTRFNKAPMLTKGRTRFDLSHDLKTTFNTGDFVPVFVEPVEPSETHSLKTSSLTRLATSLHQTMDNAYIEFDFFFVPMEIVWPNYKKMFGANDDPWTQTTVYVTPQLNLTAGSGAVTIDPQSLYNQIGIPSGSYGSGSSNDKLTIDLTSVRSVLQVYNDWYRDENFDSIVYFSNGDADLNASDGLLFNGGYLNLNAQTLKVNRFKDAFSTALQAPQRGGDVTVSIAGYAPVVGGVGVHDHYNINNPNIIDGIVLQTTNGVPSANNILNIGSSGSGFPGNVYATGASGSAPSSGNVITKSNMVTDLRAATGVTINQLRTLITAQAMSERDARGGTRVNERIYSTWGVKVPDLEVGRSQFLGGKRIPINMMEVLQTSESSSTAVLGTSAGHSKTVDSSVSFVFSSTQYGWIIGIAFTRTARSYSQGIDRKLRNKGKYTYYDPLLDNIGEVPVLKSELYSLSSANNAAVAASEAVWGYQEAWYHLKERTNKQCGYFQSGITGTLDSYHYGDNYTGLPSLSATWLKETPDQVDRTLAVNSSAAHQWELDVYFEYYVTRTMGKYSIPNTFGF